jgi:hypothetical protein
VIGTAVMVGRIATGEIVENPPTESAAAALGQKGGQARAATYGCALVAYKSRMIGKSSSISASHESG